jgi:hypothetical protein
VRACSASDYISDQTRSDQTRSWALFVRARRSKDPLEFVVNVILILVLIPILLWPGVLGTVIIISRGL